MILRRLTANFGTLSHQTLELTPGLNVIEAPNESGKSTWCAFLRVMLYGLRTSRSGKNAPKPDKELYAPWDGSPMEGAMELTWQGKDITLRRTGEGAAGPMRAFSAVYTGTNESVSALTESDAGERITGVNAEVFRRTAFIGPAGLKVTPGPELEKYIAAAVTSGEEGASFSEAAARIKAWQRRYRYRNQGKLPEQEAEIRQLENELDSLEQLTGQLEEIARREQRASAAYSELTDQLGAAAREQDLARRERRELEEETARREREAASIGEALRRLPLAPAEPDEAFWRRVRSDSRRCDKLLRERQRDPLPWGWLLCLVLAAACGAAGFFRTLFFLPGAALLAAGLYLLWRNRQSRLQKDRRTKELAALQKRYGAATPARILAAAEDYAGQYREMRSLEEAARELRAKAGAMAQRGPDVPASEALSAAGEELRRIAAQKARVQEQLRALGERGAMEKRLSVLSAAQETDERTYAALDIALAELTAADEEMHARFAPALSRRTEDIFRALTGERYTALSLDRDLTAAVQRSGDALPHADAYLSRGTREQLYLALRLALCGENDECPIILDDALVSFDDERLGYALDYLEDLAKERQILLFTCQSRERRYLRHKKH